MHHKADTDDYRAIVNRLHYKELRWARCVCYRRRQRRMASSIMKPSARPVSKPMHTTTNMPSQYHTHNSYRSLSLLILSRGWSYYRLL